MAATLNEVLKHTRFDIEPNFTKASKQLKQCLNMFINYLERPELRLKMIRHLTYCKFGLLLSVLKFVSSLRIAIQMMLL